ncbi:MULTISPECIES: sensor histidine kinase KdpD [Rhodomicrobium]|uniref:sensor histidine kinase n=1 Tax=Rhodomicrobium TaxID=1068 RepID=UPI000B4B6844|nr:MULTISPECIES: sensor histidine kinase KdpD [Rhodomicrobium]
MADERRDPRQRPSPEALLEAVRREDRTTGRLKIFVGAAPGVGKTYEMLREAHDKVRQGIDVAVGVVETHGRKETQALLDTLDIVPLRTTEYRGRTIQEMDLDAVIARRPGIALVDELAHTNAPGSRHPKRYQDVQELLDRGIDVYTTVNIQHLESLNDVIAQITRIRVRETVPDEIFDRAHAVELVDLAPEELIQRLQEGKVYIPKQADRALKHFFAPENLTALRELTLRRIADQVDDELLNQMQARAIPGPWAATERVLVCISEDPRGAGLVRYGKRLADRLHASWTAIYLETRRSSELSEEERDRIADMLRLAEMLGGDAASLPGGEISVADDIMRYAQANNVTQIVVGKSDRSRLFEMLHGSVVHDLVRRSGTISVHVIAGETVAGEPIARKTVSAAPEPPAARLPYAVAAGAIVAALGFAMLIQPWFGIENVDLVFLTAIVATAARFGLGPSLFASVMAMLCYNFFFIPPLYTFTIGDAKNVAAFVFFAIMAVIVSNVAARVRSQALAAMDRARATQRLYAFNRKLAGIGTLDDVLSATAYHIATMLNLRAAVMLPGKSGLAVKAAYPAAPEMGEADLAAARWTWDHHRTAGRGSATLSGAKWLFLPMRTGRGAIGVIGIDGDDPGPLLTPEQRRLLEALIGQGALAIERVRLVEDIDRVKRTAEADNLRAALLTSISHDLKTPLASVLGAATTLREVGTLADSERAELLATIIDESERLNRFISNLVDMTKLESGAVLPNVALEHIDDIVGSTLERGRKILANHLIELQIAAGLPPLLLDPVLIEQALFNILDNAAKYAAEGTTISIRSWRDRDMVWLQITDEGDGIPPAELELIFTKFHRAKKGDQVRAGTGLGLAIARGFIEAMQGTISAANRSDRPGAIFTISFPIPPEERAE